MSDSADNSGHPSSTQPAQAGGDGSAPKSMQTLGSLEISHEIGRGGMGTVFEGWCPDRQSKVAVKVLSQHIGTSVNAVLRFQRESKAAAGLHHPHITPIFSQGEQHGVHYYAMELIDGPSLHETISDTITALSTEPEVTDPTETVVLERRPAQAGIKTARDTATSKSSQPEYGTTEFFQFVAKHIATVADALDYAHRHGVIHRDIKPHNLMFGSDHQLRITDFGLARISEEPGVTVTGEIVGSPLYMSPEQVTFKPDELDHRTDIYSLGATLYEWLTLKPPYPGETRERVITMIMNSEPMLLRMHLPNIPVDLETICLKSIARDRDKRYRHASDLRDDLLRFLDNRPIKARRANLGERLNKYWHRNKLAVMSSTAISILMISAVIIWQMQSQVNTGAQAVQQANAQVDEAQKTQDTALNVLTSLFATLPAELRLPARAVGAAVQGVQDIVEDAAPALGVEPSQEVSPPGIAMRIVRDFYDETSLESFAGADGVDHLLSSAHDLRISKPAEALVAIDSVLSENKDHMDALMLRCVVDAELGHFQDMMVDAMHLTQLLGKDARGHLWSALASILTNQFDSALDHTNRAQQLGQRPKWSALIGALSQLGKGRAAPALSLAEAAVVDAPNLMAGLLVRGLAYAANRDYGRAVDDLSKVIAAEPNNAGALVARGQYYGGHGDFALSANDFESAMAMVGTAPAIGALWILAKNSQRQREAQAVAEKKADDAETETESETETKPEPQQPAQTLEQVQEWFQRSIWPVGTLDKQNPPFPETQPK